MMRAISPRLRLSPPSAVTAPVTTAPSACSAMSYSGLRSLGGSGPPWCPLGPAPFTPFTPFARSNIGRSRLGRLQRRRLVHEAPPERLGDGCRLLAGELG